ncbi:hypothetical protein Snov_2903 [Ancylobacter novellus DSM 506]|uniref:Uncharacterized protein n=1 Tax=Ancylobacter novellus (strain ATCC 8093 / DSM 506 / JCM 20403 / CCM 1077 / IAM 12100 / NBRC 12443 / NCIMB 10456) TaxID=639283 RepID=D6ZZB4_ANCN5|nr:hypothetical protein [Ancylobacter novellus]ADH89250.1 hypothetical protein Snov_1950 [Ancylobacter novellus DSM 506]ADH90186.1 hypothetical protein Snov_2903 [Ancylobacter novellus DSM 506]
MRADMSESTIRRRLAKVGFRLQKTPAHHWTRAEFGTGYEVVDEGDMLILGCSQRPYDATLEDVRTFVAGL